jgi:hypothetical protein
MTPGFWSTHRNRTRKIRIGHALQNEHEVVSRTLPLAPLLTVVLKQAQRIPSLRLLYAPRKYTRSHKLLEFWLPALPIESLAPTERKGGGMNPVRIHQRE